jgi:hypothetical protein
MRIQKTDPQEIESLNLGLYHKKYFPGPAPKEWA